MTSSRYLGIPLVSTDVLVSVEDGSYLERDSTEAVFREATQKATIAAIRKAQPTVMEAISICRIVFPTEYATAIEKIFAEKAKSNLPNLKIKIQVSRLSSRLLV